MKAALDVCYHDDRAIAACVVFDDWLDTGPAAVFRVATPIPARYRAGRFFERELPCLLAVLDSAEQEFDTVLIDGYVHLKTDLGKGLGVHLFESLPYRTTVIGVAKSPLSAADRFVPVTRGRSARPLFVSAIGCPLAQAAENVAGMHGLHRIPTLLRLADRHARGLDEPSARLSVRRPGRRP